MFVINQYLEDDYDFDEAHVDFWMNKSFNIL